MMFPGTRIVENPSLYPPQVPPQNPSQYPPQRTPKEHLEHDENHSKKEHYNNQFNTKEIRKTFITKVYFILTIQMVIVVGFVLFFIFHEPSKQWIKNNSFMIYIAFAVSCVCIVFLGCCLDIRRQVPMNYIFLALFTVAEGFLLGFSACFQTPYAVLMSVSVTAIISSAIMIFALQTKWDFTPWGGYLICVSVPVLILGIVWIFVKNDVLNYVYGAIACILFSIYLVYDTQLMMIGKHKYTLGPHDYVFAALNLYTDIIQIFMLLVDMFRTKNG